MLLQSLRMIVGKFALWLGSTLALLSVAAASIVTYQTYAPEYYAAAMGLSLVIAGLLTIF